MTSSKFTYVAYLRTTSETLWNALTKAEIMRKYWFGMYIESGWKTGSPWRMYSEGTLMDSGEILESTPMKRVVLKWLNEWKPELKAEGHSRCVINLDTMGTTIKLTITHALERPDSKFIAAVSEGWPMIVSNLKSLLETGELALVAHPGHGG